MLNISINLYGKLPTFFIVSWHWNTGILWVLNFQSCRQKDVIQDIVKQISSTLNLPKFVDLMDLVGIDSRLEKLRMYVNAGSDDVRMIGIWGMGGIGKTTIARVLYNLIISEFEGGSFLEDVREIAKGRGLVFLQNQLLSDMRLGMEINAYDVYDGISMIKTRLGQKKVLIILDDVDQADQLNMLAGNRNWFGPGSRIIVTTRDKNLLTTHGVDEVYKIEELNDGEALVLFSVTAFGSHLPPDDYLELSINVTKYACGLPFALKYWGNILRGGTRREWKSLLEEIKRFPGREIISALQISFDGLDESDKEIFLHVVCFFTGKDRGYATKILESCGFNAVIGLSNLINKSLINVLPNNELSMPDLIQKMGQHIIAVRESPEKFEKCRRLLEEGNVRSHMLTKSMGCKSFSALFLVLETMSVVLDQYGNSKQGFLLAAFLISAFGFVVSLYAYIKKRTTAEFRQQAERQLAVSEVAISVVQLVTTLIQYMLAVVGVKNNHIGSFSPLAFSIIVLVFAFKKEKIVNTRDRFSNIQQRASVPEVLISIPREELLRERSHS